MSPAEEEAFPLTDTQIADNAVKTLEGFKASGAAKPFFVACGFRETGTRISFAVSATAKRLQPAPPLTSGTRRMSRE